jgi:ribosomal protein S18 acetylase RimI-like enzyme
MTGVGTTRKVCIEPIEVGQLDLLLSLCREHAAYEGAEFTENGQQERWREALFSTPPALHCWLALDGAEPAGFMSVTVDFATWRAERFAHMDCLYVREPYRGLGLGRAFFELLQEFCAAHQYRSVEWQTPPDNELGIAFYKRLGAKALPKLRYTLDTAGGSPC